MSRHYLLDGYNIIKQTPGLADLPLEEGRRALLTWINSARPQGSAGNAVTVVFDGDPNVFGGMPGGSAQVIFTDTGSADDKIKDIVESSTDPKKFVVVSNDKGITLYVRALGAHTVSVQEFTGTAVKVSKSKTGVKNSGTNKALGKNISLTSEAKINKEFFKIWLKEE